jgi:hypothetical protein
MARWQSSKNPSAEPNQFVKVAASAKSNKKSTEAQISDILANKTFTEAEIDKAIAQMSKYATVTDENIAEIKRSMKELGSFQETKTESPKNSKPVKSETISYRTFRGGDLFQIEVPDNWLQETMSSMTVVFTPPNGKTGDDIVHGLAIEATQESWQSLEEAMEALGKAAIRKKNYLRIQLQSEGKLNRYRSIGIKLSGQPKTGKPIESMVFYGILLGNGKLLYITIFSPESELTVNMGHFNKMLNSLQIQEN